MIFHWSGCGGSLCVAIDVGDSDLIWQIQKVLKSLLWTAVTEPEFPFLSALGVT